MVLSTYVFHKQIKLIYSFRYRSRGKGIPGIRKSLGKSEMVRQSLSEKPGALRGQVLGHMGDKDERLEKARSQVRRGLKCQAAALGPQVSGSTGQPTGRKRPLRQ